MFSSDNLIQIFALSMTCHQMQNKKISNNSFPQDGASEKRILERTLTGTWGELLDVQRQLDSTQRELEEMRRKFQEKEVEHNATRILLNQTRFELKDIKTQLKQSNDQQKRTALQLNGTIIELEQTRLQLNESNGQLENTALKLNQSNDELEKTALRLNQSNTELEKTALLLKKARELETQCALQKGSLTKWDMLYSCEYYNKVLTRKLHKKLRTSCSTLPKILVGVNMTDTNIELIKHLHEEETCE